MGKSNFLLFIIIFGTLLFVLYFFINKFLPFWQFALNNTEIPATVISSKLIEEKQIIELDFSHNGFTQKRKRGIPKDTKIKVGEILTIRINKKYPDYFEIKGIDQSVGLFSSLLAPGIIMFCLIAVVLSLFGKIDLDNFY